MDEVKSAETELRQDSILVAWIQTAAGEDRLKDHDNRWTPYRIFDLRQESRRDIRQWTGNGPACKQHHSKLFLSAETAEIRPTITLHGCRKNTGPFSHIKSCRLLQQHFYGATNIVMRRLQSVLNAAARLISNKRKFDDRITPVLRDQLHWLPFSQRIEFKIAVFVRNAIHGRGPTYLSRTCILSGRSAPGLICGLLCGATWSCLEPKPVASGLEVSASPDRLFGTHCPMTLEFPNCRWNVSNLCWKHTYLFIYFIDLSQKSLHNYTFQIDASKNITLYVKG